jgi:ribosomal protein L11 methyltransferase
MKWTKVSVQVSSSDIDKVTGLLLACGISNVEIIDPREYGVFLQQDKQSWDYVDESLVNVPLDGPGFVVFYLSSDTEDEAALPRIKERLEALMFNVVTECVDDAAWLDEWKKHFAPIHINRVAIVPEWEKAPMPNPPEIVFTLDPGSAFGTGQHATTYLCVEALQEYIKPGHVILDAGCGSGILSVIALQLGAERVVACDIDPSAISATYKNAGLNPVDISALKVLHGNIITDDKTRAAVSVHEYDVIVANIVADVVIALLPHVPALLKESGFFIASGIIGERAGDVRRVLEGNGLALVNEKEMDGWYCMVCAHG